MPKSEAVRPSDAELSVPRGKSAIEIYRGVGGWYGWRVVVVAEDDSERALREAQALASGVEADLRKQYGHIRGRPQQ
jgi:hypothetical protein